MSKAIFQLLCFASIIESDFIFGGHKMLSRSCKYFLSNTEGRFETDHGPAWLLDLWLLLVAL